MTFISDTYIRPEVYLGPLKHLKDLIFSVKIVNLLKYFHKIALSKMFLVVLSTALEAKTQLLKIQLLKSQMQPFADVLQNRCS